MGNITMDGLHWANIRLISLTVVLLYHYKPLTHFPLGFIIKRNAKFSVLVNLVNSYNH